MVPPRSLVLPFLEISLRSSYAAALFGRAMDTSATEASNAFSTACRSVTNLECLPQPPTASKTHREISRFRQCNLPMIDVLFAVYGS